MLDMYADDAVFDVSAVFTDVAPMHGSKEIRRYWDTLRDTWDGLRIDPLQGFDLGAGRVVIDPGGPEGPPPQLFPDLETAIETGSHLRQELPQVDREV